VACWAPFLACFLSRPRAAAALLALPVAIGTPLAALRLVPAIESYLNTRAVAEAMGVAAPERAPLVMVDPAPPSLRLYLHRNLVPGVGWAGGKGPREESWARTFEEFRASDHLTYVAFRPASEDQVVRTAGVPVEILIRTHALVLARLHPR